MSAALRRAADFIPTPSSDPEERVSSMNDGDLQTRLPSLEGHRVRFGRFVRRSEGPAFSRTYLIGRRGRSSEER